MRPRAGAASVLVGGRMAGGATTSAGWLVPRCWRTAAKIVAGLVIAVIVPAAVQAQPLQPIPPLQARVTDRTGTLSPPQTAEIESKLAALEARKGAQVAVLIVPTTAPEAIEQYSMRVAEAWKIGRGKVEGKGAGVDDGVILVVAKNDRRVRIEVGYGLEGTVPDAIAKRIITEAIAPRFRNQDFFGGIDAGLSDIIARIDGEELPPMWQVPGTASQPSSSSALEAVLPIVLFAMVGGMIATQVLGRFLGAAAGGLGAGVLTAGLAGSLLFAGAAAVGVFMMVLLMGGSRQRGLRRVGPHTFRGGPIFLPGPWGGGGGGGFGGGGFGGGSWGGGGGGFGGGGASGDW